MFERFTERARQVVILAQDEARALKHNYIGTEHLLLGLIREEEGLAASVLASLDVTLERVRVQVVEVIGQGDNVTGGQIPFTPRAKKVLELSLREALSRGHKYIGTEHVLLGIVRENEGVAAQVLRDFDADAEKIRNEVMRKLSGPAPLVELLAEIERVRAEKEQAIEAQELERAAALGEHERRLAVAARRLVDEWTEDAYAVAVPEAGESPPAEAVQRRQVWQAQPLLVGWALFGIAAGLGVLVGWLIWG